VPGWTDSNKNPGFSPRENAGFLRPRDRATAYLNQRGAEGKSLQFSGSGFAAFTIEAEWSILPDYA